jgi:hypothetical protein
MKTLKHIVKFVFSLPLFLALYLIWVLLLKDWRLAVFGILPFPCQDSEKVFETK